MVSDPEISQLHWQSALMSLSEGHSDDLARLVLQCDGSIPKDVRVVLARLLIGYKVPSRRGKSNTLLTPAQRTAVALKLSVIDLSSERLLAHTDHIADVNRLEPLAVKRAIEASKKVAYKRLAHRHGVSFNTIRQMRNGLLSTTSSDAREVSPAGAVTIFPIRDLWFTALVDHDIEIHLTG